MRTGPKNTSINFKEQTDQRIQDWILPSFSMPRLKLGNVKERSVCCRVNEVDENSKRRSRPHIGVIRSNTPQWNK